MANIVIPFVAVALAQVPSVGFNNNFTEIAGKFNTYAVQTDVAKVITVGHTWNASQTFAGATFTADVLFTDALYDIGKAGATRPRDAFFSRNLTAAGITATGSAEVGSNTASGEIFDITSGTLNTTTYMTVNIQSRARQLILGMDSAGRGIIGTLSNHPLDFRVGNTQYLSIATTGTVSIQSGHLIFSTDATNDIGASGATRPRDLFLSRNLTMGGQFNLGPVTSILPDPGFPTLGTQITMAAGGYWDFRKAGGGSALLIADTGNIQVSNGILVAVNGGVKTLLSTNAALPAAAAGQNGLLALDTTNSRLIYYVGGLRYFIPIGTSF